MNTHRPKATFAIAALAVLLVAGSALYAAEPFARTVTSASEIAWQPTEGFASADLTVSGPDGRVHSFHFKEGAALRLKLADLPAGALDGSYVFELRLNPYHRLRSRGVEPSRMDPLDARRGATSRPEEAGISRIVTGSFNVQGGLVMDPSATEDSTPRAENSESVEVSTTNNGAVAQPEAQVIADDFVVQGSLCVGLDCQSLEVFGFDTVRLKENNTRLKFDDTSSTGSFPFTDWQLTANESNNGGLNKFSIEDVTNARIPFTILANSPSNSIFVDAGGRIGLRTATPVVDMHMKMGNTPTMRLEQDGTLGFTPRTWDVGGNEVSFFIRDVSAAPTGCSNPTLNYDCRLRLQVNPDGSWTTSTGATLSAAGVWTILSSASVKQDIRELDTTIAEETLRNLRPVTFEYKADPTEQYVGFIAEEVPDLVATNDRQGLSPMDVVAVLTKVVQEQQKTIDELAARLAELENANAGRK